jgi:hypothetical protein
MGGQQQQQQQQGRGGEEEDEVDDELDWNAPPPRTSSATKLVNMSMGQEVWTSATSGALGVELSEGRGRLRRRGGPHLLPHGHVHQLRRRRCPRRRRVPVQLVVHLVLFFAAPPLLLLLLLLPSHHISHLRSVPIISRRSNKFKLQSSDHPRNMQRTSSGSPPAIQ